MQRSTPFLYLYKRLSSLLFNRGGLQKLKAKENTMLNTELKDRLDDIIDRYKLSDYRAQLDKNIEGEGIKIGFLGAFSSGKTSLLNSIFSGLNLPVDIAPTTKSICFIVQKMVKTLHFQCSDFQFLKMFG